jgi:bacterioferritin (cytochrome b1)
LKHEEKFRAMIGGYLDGVPTMEMSQTYGAKEDPVDILTVNLRQEKHAIDFYKQIYRKVMDNRQQLQYTAEVLEHEIRHIIKDEQEHVSEISQLLGVDVQEKIRQVAKAGV